MHLANENIHVCYCDMRRFPVVQEHLFGLLNELDQTRYHAFKNKTRQCQFAMARWMIKHILKQQFGLSRTHDYQLIGFTKWRVIDSEQVYSVSISHSGHYVAVAIARFGCAIGLDIEQHKCRNYDELLKVFSTRQEQALLSKLVAKQEMFYRLWCAKEAFLKVSQYAIEQVYQEDLSDCLTDEHAQVLDYSVQSGDLASGNYSYCLMTDTAEALPTQVSEWSYPCVEP